MANLEARRRYFDELDKKLQLDGKESSSFSSDALKKHHEIGESRKSPIYLGDLIQSNIGDIAFKVSTSLNFI